MILICEVSAMRGFHRVRYPQKTRPRKIDTLRGRGFWRWQTWNLNRDLMKGWTVVAFGETIYH